LQAPLHNGQSDQMTPIKMTRIRLKLIHCVVCAAALLTSLSAAALQLGQIKFSSCEIGKGLSLTKAECGYLTVPLNFAEASGRTIKLHVALIAANARKPEADPAVYLAGGPGQSASESYGQIASGFREILKTRHALKCKMPDDAALQTPDPAAARAMVQACLREQDVDPRFFTTTDATHDLEALRIAIDAPMLNLIGFSYGTRVAQQFAMHFPNSTRSLILDGIAPNELILGSEHAQALDEALAKQFARCAKDKVCSARFGDPAATLAQLYLDLKANPREISMPDPLSGKTTTFPLGLSALQGMARFYAYASETSALLPLLLDEAKQGRPQALVAQGQMAGQTIGDAMSYGMQLSVMCAEDAEFLRPNANDANRLLGNEMAEMLGTQCAEWPKGARPKDFFQPLKSTIPTLLISGELDPVTPPRYGEAVLKGLANAVHVVAPAMGHVNLSRGCIPKLAATFLQNMQPKLLDTDCVKDIMPAPFFLEFTGPAP
jgi:pimeloyl-ACP methyl ester carboxylesterase